MSAEQEFDRQAATFYSVAEFLKEGKVTQNAPIALELFFIPEAEADQPAFLKALKTFGYSAVTESENTTDGTEREAVLVTVETKLTAEDIWLHEERCTKLAQPRGFAPDGWGFLEPDA
ncbi:MAG: ribonuclease E inhibitor RraB [Rhodobacteraceae bacterium]|nr:ribonuclease E inhibitor RraB [Paracoccaceae bacterium]